MGVNAGLRYVGAKTYEDFMPVIDLSGMSSGSMSDMKFWMGTYSARHPGYAVCNAAVNFYYQDILNLTLGVDNITDYRPKVVNFNSAILARRNFFLRVAWTFGAD